MQRVYLVYHNRIFGDALHAILTTQPGIELVGMAQTSTQLAADVAATATDVILLEETDDGPAVEEVRALLASPAPHRLITLRLDVDGMHVWSQTWRQTVQTRDLVEAIVGGEHDG